MPYTPGCVRKGVCGCVCVCVCVWEREREGRFIFLEFAQILVELFWKTIFMTKGQMFFKWANLGISFVYSRSFQQTHNTILTRNKCEKCHVHPVYSGGIRTHDISNMSHTHKKVKCFAIT